jgi:signal transduction histidine kinase
MKELVSEYKRSINAVQVTPDDHKAISVEMMKNVEMSLLALDKSVSFIRGIKGQSINLNDAVQQKFNAGQVIFDTLNLLGFKIRKSRCRLSTDIDDSIMFYGNQRWLSQIVTNLVNNAAEASVITEGSIEVKLIRSGQEKAHLIVEDNGSGISPENISKIFDPLFTTKPFGEGTGLGLSIVQELVSQFNGSIIVKSEAGLTTFTVEFPTYD